MRQDKQIGLGGLSSLVLLVFSLVFYKERIIFIDAAYQAFFLIHKGSFSIQNNRFAEALPQTLPLLTIRLGCSLKMVLMAFSASYVLWHFIFFSLSAFALKDKQMALAGALFSVLMVAQTFYWVPSELPLGISFSFFAWAMIRNKSQHGERRWRYLGYFVLAFALVFFHPTLMFVVAFSVCFFLITEPSNYKKWAYFSAMFVGILVFKMLFFKTSDYDKNAFGKLHNFITLFPHYFGLTSNKQFLKNCLTDYYWLPFFLLGIFAFYFKEKEFKKLAFLFVSFFGYMLLINVSYHEGADKFYLENLYLPLSVFVILPFVVDILPKMEIKKSMALLILVFLTSWIRIGMSHQPFTKRLDFEQHILNETANVSNKKIIFHEAAFPNNPLIMSWGTSFEMLLLSALNSPQEARYVAIDAHPENYQWAIDENQYWISKWNMVKNAEMNRKYFDNKDESKYVILQSFGNYDQHK